MQDLVALLPLVAIALIFWLLVIRPQTRRSRDLMAMQAGLAVGDEVMLTSGFFGTLTAVDEETVHVELAAGTVVKVAKGAVGQRLEDPETAQVADPADERGKDVD